MQKTGHFAQKLKSKFFFGEFINMQVTYYIYWKIFSMLCWWMLQG